MSHRHVRNQTGRIITFTAAVGVIRAVLEKDREFHLTARGNSMSPFIKPADIITLSSYNGTSPEVGDIVAVYLPRKKMLIVHRLIARHPNGFVMAGDNSFRMDGLVRNQEIVGKVTEVQRNGHRKKTGVETYTRTIAWARRQSLRGKGGQIVWRGMLQVAKKVLA